MIVREIANDPTIADNFDHFNDYGDTSGWLMGMLIDCEERDRRRELMIALQRLNEKHLLYCIQQQGRR